jgi:hypothetical protein
VHQDIGTVRIAGQGAGQTWDGAQYLRHFHPHVVQHGQAVGILAAVVAHRLQQAQKSSVLVRQVDDAGL